MEVRIWVTHGTLVESVRWRLRSVSAVLWGRPVGVEWAAPDSSEQRDAISRDVDSSDSPTTKDDRDSTTDADHDALGSVDETGDESDQSTDVGEPPAGVITQPEDTAIEIPDQEAIEGEDVEEVEGEGSAEEVIDGVGGSGAETEESARAIATTATTTI